MPDRGKALPHQPRRRQVSLPHGPLTLWVPSGTDALLDQLADAPPDPDDKMPYWADLWPSAIALAESIDRGLIPVAGRQVLELGAGLGLASLAAARGGGHVIATDWDSDALRYVAASAAENNLTLDVAQLDWRAPPSHLSAPTVLAADVLYEARNVVPLLHALSAVVADDGEIWLSDPGRAHLPAFVAQASAYAFGHREHVVEAPDKSPIKIQVLRMQRR